MIIKSIFITIKLIFITIKIVFMIIKLAFLTLKMTFLSLKIVFLAIRIIFRIFLASNNDPKTGIIRRQQIFSDRFLLRSQNKLKYPDREL